MIANQSSNASSSTARYSAVFDGKWWNRLGGADPDLVGDLGQRVPSNPCSANRLRATRRMVSLVVTPAVTTRRIYFAPQFALSGFECQHG